MNTSKDLSNTFIQFHIKKLVYHNAIVLLLLLLIHGASIEQIQVHFCGRRLDSVYIFLSKSWSETFLTHLNLRPVGGHPWSVVVLPPFEVVLLVDGHQRLMELVVHCLNTDKSTACVGWSVFPHRITRSASSTSAQYAVSATCIYIIIYIVY